jgi:hypothetical protein
MLKIASDGRLTIPQEGDLLVMDRVQALVLRVVRPLGPTQDPKGVEEEGHTETLLVSNVRDGKGLWQADIFLGDAPDGSEAYIARACARLLGFASERVSLDESRQMFRLKKIG